MKSCFMFIILIIISFYLKNECSLIHAPLLYEATYMFCDINIHICHYEQEISTCSCQTTGKPLRVGI